MDTDGLTRIEGVFEEYVRNFAREIGPLHPLLELKVVHSRRVAQNCRTIAVGIGCDDLQVNCGQAIGLLHDIGRFRQFADHRTLSDKDSIDHGEAGYALLQELKILEFLPESERQAVLDSVRYHNRHEIPHGVLGTSLPYLKLIRDADKLDIFKVVVDEIRNDGFEHLQDIKAGVSKSLRPSSAAVEEVRTRRSMSMDSVTSLGDFILLQLAWVYDFNYPPTHRLLMERGLMDTLIEHLDGTEDANRLLADMRDFAGRSVAVSNKEKLRNSDFWIV